MTVTMRVKPVVWTVIAVALAVVLTLVVSDRWSATAAPGDTDATYNPTAGCRLTDTRPGSNIGPRATKLGADEEFTVKVHGANGECTGPLAIPTDAIGVAMNATIVNATTSSNVRIYPADTADVPLLSNLNVTAGGPPTPNKVDVQLSPSGEIKVYNFKGSVDVVLDVVGFYTSASLRSLAASAGTPGPAGPQGATGPAGLSPWEEIPEGETVTGTIVWTDILWAMNADHEYSRGVDLPGIAPSDLTNDRVNVKGSLSTDNGDAGGCDGSSNSPTAPPGQVCIYPAGTNNVDDFAAFAGALEDRSFEVLWRSDGFNGAGAQARFRAVWAYTSGVTRGG